MRPDQHKKKRSAQYKKKHGIQKDTGTKEKSTQQSREEKGKVEDQNSTTETNTPKAYTPAAEVTPSFSRRKIESNWDRYEGLPNADEEETITAKGVDFKRLLSETGHAEAQFRFRDEQSWEEEGAANNEAGIKFLSVDIDALGHHIQSIAVPERLGISRSLFEDALLTKVDKEAKDESSKETHSMSNGDMLHTPKNDDKLHVQSRLEQDTYKYDIDSIAKNAENTSSGRTQPQTNKQNHGRTSELKTNTAHLKESIKISAQIVGKVGYEASTAVQNLPDDMTLESGDGRVKSTGDDNADDDLDFLLSLENPVQVKGQSVMSDVKEEKEKEQKLIEESETISSRPLEAQEDQQSSEVEKARHPEVESTVKTGTDDLEDWLDDMLDD